jgi:2-dehydro-3-deoxyphosphooctonate aldolase (KDO 8-P synthase)
MTKKVVKVGYGKINPISIGHNLPLVFVGGPCAIESRDHAFKMAEKIGEICQRVGIEWIYKSCYDKDCRLWN